MSHERPAHIQVRRHPERGVYDRKVIDSILDEALVCHVGFVHDGRPFVIPTIHVRVDDRLYFHGSPASRMLQCMAAGEPVCVTVTLVDGLVLARSAFHHSMNYRSVVVLGRGEAVVDRAEKEMALAAILEHVVPGRAKDVRLPSGEELEVTMVVRVEISEASGKVRTGPPIDSQADRDPNVWAGLIPLALTAGEPVPDAIVKEHVGVPSYASAYSPHRTVRESETVTDHE